MTCLVRLKSASALTDCHTNAKLLKLEPLEWWRKGNAGLSMHVHGRKDFDTLENALPGFQTLRLCVVYVFWLKPVAILSLCSRGWSNSISLESHH